jgi:carbonic anhydrase
VSPEVIFDAGPGELFVVRNVANLVPVYQPDGGAHGVSAALEYAVRALHVKHIVVLGHAQCGGIRAFVDNNAPLSPGDFIGRWMSMFIKPGERVGPQPGKPADVSVRADARRARRTAAARRLFRRRRGLAVRARSGGEGISQREGRLTRLIDRRRH